MNTLLKFAASDLDAAIRARRADSEKAYNNMLNVTHEYVSPSSIAIDGGIGLGEAALGAMLAPKMTTLMKSPITSLPRLAISGGLALRGLQNINKAVTGIEKHDAYERKANQIANDMAAQQNAIHEAVVNNPTAMEDFAAAYANKNNALGFEKDTYAPKAQRILGAVGVPTNIQKNVSMSDLY